MRKALLAIVLAIASLVPVGLTASPASAVSCSSQTYVQGSTAHNVDPGGPVSSATYLATTRIRYQQCVDPTGIFRRVKSIDWVFQRTSGNSSLVDKFRGNPNVVGSWNPGEKTTTYHTLTWTAPAGTDVYKSDPANERCLGGNATYVINVYPDVTKAMPSVCVISPVG